MFNPARWAVAFAECCGSGVEGGLAAFRVFCAAFGASGGRVLAGTGAANRAEALAREALREAGFSSGGGGVVSAQETALRFFCLLVKKGYFHRREELLAEMGKECDRARGVVRVRLEMAETIGGAFDGALTEKLIGITGAKEIVLEKKTNPDILGGFRLYIGTELYDGSLDSRVRALERALR